ncbi:unnamed protein product [Dibothriocephalus latus]|uniref:Uncharacterized protein n=1 Tax=Dibothriocephalus latus TaxID=60516 RepID=A0A3P7LVA4_DIBLA|nr:unnamed protein product [Dibothriocephalus latus]
MLRSNQSQRKLKLPCRWQLEKPRLVRVRP